MPWQQEIAMPKQKHTNPPSYDGCCTVGEKIHRDGEKAERGFSNIDQQIQPCSQCPSADRMHAFRTKNTKKNIESKTFHNNSGGSLNSVRLFFRLVFLRSQRIFFCSHFLRLHRLCYFERNSSNHDYTSNESRKIHRSIKHNLRRRSRARQSTAWFERFLELFHFFFSVVPTHWRCMLLLAVVG